MSLELVLKSTELQLINLIESQLKLQFNKNFNLECIGVDISNRGLNKALYMVEAKFKTALRNFSVTYNPQENSLQVNLRKELFEELKCYSDYKIMEDNFSKVINDYNLSNLLRNDKFMPFLTLCEGHRVKINNFLETYTVSGELVNQSLSMRAYYFTTNEEKSIPWSFDFDNKMLSINYFVKYITKQGSVNSKYSRNDSVDYYHLFEDFFYSTYLKPTYNIKRKTAKELELIKMIRYC